MSEFSHSARQVSIAARTFGATLCLVLVGCTTPTPRYDAQEGDALQRAKQNQSVLPTPAQRRTPAPSVTSAEVQRAVSSATSSQVPSLSSGASIGAGATGSLSGSSSTTGTSGGLR